MSIVSGRTLAALLSAGLALTVSAAGTRGDGADLARYRGWVQQMKTVPRGPFRRIRWFCTDGAVLEPKPFACKDHGGGVQHGELGARAMELRSHGYLVANVLADLHADAFLARADHREALAQILVEQFLIRADDGWILRQARYYRGAFQEEDERQAASGLLRALAASDAHLHRDFALLRTAARLLPHGSDRRSANLVRQLSAALSERDPGFVELRNKIHGHPQATDAARVREHAREVKDPGLAREFEKLADAIDALYAPSSSVDTLRALAKTTRDGDLARALRARAETLERADGAAARYLALAGALAELRDRLPGVRGGTARLAVLDASLALETDLFVASSGLEHEVAGATRARRARWLAAAAEAAYGVGLVSERQREALAASGAALTADNPTLARYKGALDYLSLVPAWATQRLRFHFGDAMQRLGELEPKASHFIEDALRGSPLFFFAHVLDGMLRDANRMAGVRNELFGADVGAGLRALNPGLARGRLLASPADDGAFAADGIYLLPETTSDLPPVAGILTAGEGNPLSHVQLLARNLGIPNVGVDEALVDALTPHLGRRVILAVSPAGSVRLTQNTGTDDTLPAAGTRTEERALIHADLDKLDLGERRLLDLGDLRAADSGRTVGPKAAKLGELKHQFPEAVAEGLAIPFGVFRATLDAPYGSGGRSVFQWMQASYRRLEAMPEGSAQRAAATETFRAELYDRVLHADPGEEFRQRLRQRMEATFGPDGSYGVFVRSDTNVEDLPGFTGAGLNLTVPNVVGVDAVLAALSRVWASPFTARAFAWRQSHMEGPEHVYPAVLLLKSINGDKSGVMVTRDIDSGADGWLSVAVNEGVGGAVDGQAAESLRINVNTGQVRLLAQATAPWRRQVSLAGGVEKLPASGADQVLQPGEIDQLIELYKVLPARFPAIVDADGKATPADIEFGFLDGRLKLFQIRPFLESSRARGNAYLASLDAGLADLDAIHVDMNEVPP